MHAPCLRAQTKEQSGGLDAKNYPGFPWLPANKADKSWATPMEDVSGVLFAHERAQVALAEWLVDNMSAKTPTRFIYSSAELPVQWAIEFLQLTDTGSLGVFRFNCRGKRAIVRKLTLDLRRALGVKPAPPPPVCVRVFSKNRTPPPLCVCVCVSNKKPPPPRCRNCPRRT